MPLEPSFAGSRIQTTIHACTEIYTHLQTNLNKIENLVNLAVGVLPAEDLVVVVSNMHSIKCQIAEIEPYFRALQVR